MLRKKNTQEEKHSQDFKAEENDAKEIKELTFKMKCEMPQTGSAAPERRRPLPSPRPGHHGLLAD